MNSVGAVKGRPGVGGGSRGALVMLRRPETRHLLVLSSACKVLGRLPVFLRHHLEMGDKKEQKSFLHNPSKPFSTLSFKRDRRGKRKIQDG